MRTRGNGRFPAIPPITILAVSAAIAPTLPRNVFSLGQGERDRMDFDGCINLMKGAIVTANIVSTVSPRYAEEICTPEYSHGLYPVLNENRAKLCGILNGIDYAYYNPAKDKELAENFSWRTKEKKTENKACPNEGAPFAMQIAV